MSMTNSAENNLLLLLFNNTNWANVGDATGLRGASAAGSFYVSLHTADPGEAGDQTTSEATYTSYARVAVARSGAGWTVSANQVSNAAAVTFPQCTGGSNTITHFGIGRTSSGSGELLFRAPVGGSAFIFTARASDDVLVVPGISFTIDDRVSFHADPNGTLPTGVTEGTLYYVKTVSGSEITISTSSGGATVNLTADGYGVAVKCTPINISNLITPSFGVGALFASAY